MFVARVVPRVSHGLVALLHGVTVIVTIPRLVSPWNPVSNHFFIAGMPILAAFVALYLLRDSDHSTVPGMLCRDA